MTAAETRTARKPITCEDCRDTIEAGQQYARHVAFPGDEANADGTRPRVLRLCHACQTKYGRGMPPRRTKERAA